RARRARDLRRRGRRPVPPHRAVRGRCLHALQGAAAAHGALLHARRIPGHGEKELMRRRAPVTFTILVLVAIVFAVEYWTNAVNDDQVLMRLGAILPLRALQGEYWRFLTGMFLHGGVLHWLVNSWAIFQLGSLY